MAAQFVVGSVVEARGWHRDRPTAFWKLSDNLAGTLQHGWVGYLASWDCNCLEFGVLVRNKKGAHGGARCHTKRPSRSLAGQPRVGTESALARW